MKASNSQGKTAITKKRSHHINQDLKISDESEEGS